jgi:hypothetical protein
MLPMSPTYTRLFISIARCELWTHFSLALVFFYQPSWLPGPSGWSENSGKCDILQQPEPRTHNLTYLEMVRLLGTADYFIAKRDSWPEGTYLKYTGDTLLRKYKGSVFEEYFGCPEDVEARDWLVFQGSPLRP